MTDNPRSFIPLFCTQGPYIPSIRRDSEGSDGFPAARTGGPGDTGSSSPAHVQVPCHNGAAHQKSSRSPPATRSRSSHHQNANTRMGSVPGGTNKVIFVLSSQEFALIIQP